MAFHVPHVNILGNHNCGKERREAFNIQGESHDIFCMLNYAERVVSSFPSKYNNSTTV